MSRAVPSQLVAEKTADSIMVFLGGHERSAAMQTPWGDPELGIGGGRGQPARHLDRQAPVQLVVDEEQGLPDLGHVAQRLDAGDGLAVGIL